MGGGVADRPMEKERKEVHARNRFDGAKKSCGASRGKKEREKVAAFRSLLLLPPVAQIDRAESEDAAMP